VLLQDRFTIEGQVYGPVDAARPSTPDLAAASDSGRSSTDNITNITTPTFTGTAAAGSEVSLTANGTVVGTATAAADGSYSVAPSAALAGGPHTMKVSVPHPAAATDPTAAPTLESGGLNISVDVTAPVATIDGQRPTDGTIDSTPTFNFSSAEAGSRFECQLIRSGVTVVDFQACTSPITYDEQPSAQYTFNVRATDPAGNVGTAASHTWTIGTVVAAPGIPGTPSATAGDSQATGRWTAPTSGGAVSGYTVNAYANDGATVSTSVSAGSSATSAVVPGLTNGTPYTFAVVATNSGGSTSSARSASVTPSAAVRVTVPGAPGQPTATAGDASANVSWTPPTNTGGTAITEYRLQVRRGTNVIRTISGIPGTTTSTTVTGLTNGVAYNFRVRAVNSAGVGALSTASTAVTPQGTTTTATVPARPAAPTATAGVAGGAMTATASWTAPADGGSAITGYIVRALRMSSTGSVLQTITSSCSPQRRELSR
jgi:hypothetical protein